MRGFIRRRGQSWELRVYLGRDPVSGRERYATRSMRGSRRDAERLLREMVAAAEAGVRAPCRGLTARPAGRGDGLARLVLIGPPRHLNPTATPSPAHLRPQLRSCAHQLRNAGLWSEYPCGRSGYRTEVQLRRLPRRRDGAGQLALGSRGGVIDAPPFRRHELGHQHQSAAAGGHDFHAGLMTPSRSERPSSRAARRLRRSACCRWCR